MSDSTYQKLIYQKWIKWIKWDGIHPSNLQWWAFKPTMVSVPSYRVLATPPKKKQIFILLKYLLIKHTNILQIYLNIKST